MDLMNSRKDHGVSSLLALDGGTNNSESDDTGVQVGQYKLRNVICAPVRSLEYDVKKQTKPKKQLCKHVNEFGKSCKLSARTNRLCWKHYGKEHCMDEDCPKLRRLKGYCIAHARTNLDPVEFEILHSNVRKNICTIENCTKTVAFKKFCTPHAKEFADPVEYAAWYKQSRECKVDGCTVHMFTRGLCNRHARERLGKEYEALVAKKRYQKQTRKKERVND